MRLPWPTVTRGHKVIPINLEGTPSVGWRNNKSRTPFPRLALGLVAAIAALVSSTGASYAQFRVCNRSSSDEVYVALGLLSGPSGWQSEGWYTVTRNDCSTVVRHALNNRFYYLY